MDANNKRCGSGSDYKTPEYFHCLTNARFRSNVYEPEADTFLFMEALDKDAERLATRLLRDAPAATPHEPRRRRCCVEIGAGSGTVLTHLGALLLQKAALPTHTTINTTAPSLSLSPSPDVVPQSPRFPLFIAVDVNPISLEASSQTWTDTMRKFFPQFSTPEATDKDEASATTLVRSLTPGEPFETTMDNDAPLRPVLRVIRSDLFTALPPPISALHDAVVCDVVLFNPPYVPTSMEELEATVKAEDVITAAWSGGPRGRVVLDRFLQQLPTWLARDGACYIVLIRENDVEDVYAYVHAQFRRFHGLADDEAVIKVEQVASRYTGEHLSIHRITYLAQQL